MSQIKTIPKPLYFIEIFGVTMAAGEGCLARFLLILLLSVFSTTGFAQYEGDDVYDPFADYSEFEENSQEEADINFFRNGRFFNIAFLMGGKMLTGGMAQHIDPAPTPGLSLTYWFNLRLALQFSYTYSQHLLGPINGGTDGGGSPISYEGNMSVNSLSFDMKYYLNTNNVTRGLAELNPYFLIGFSQNTRNFALVGEAQVAKDEGAGLDLGFGIEVPVAHNEMFVGFQFVYTYVNFATENQRYPSPIPSGYDGEVFQFDGDMMNAHFVFGFNFL